MRVSFVEDLPQIREYIAARVRAQSKVDAPISAIEIGYQLCQAGLVVLHFDVREQHDRDGEWTHALDGPTLELPHWQAAYESAGEEGISFVLPTGVAREVAAGAGDEAVASVFGEALLAIALDALASHAFQSLSLREGAQLDIEEFDGMWAWPCDYDDLGRSNLIRELVANRLPK